VSAGAGLEVPGIMTFASVFYIMGCVDHYMSQVCNPPMMKTNVILLMKLY